MTVLAEACCARGVRCALVLGAIVLTAMFATPSLASAAYGVTSHGGPVESKPEVFEIFWGGTWSSGAPATERSRLESMYNDLNLSAGSAWQGILTEYGGPEKPLHPEEATDFGFVSHSVAIGAPYTDPEGPPAGVTTEKMETEVKKAIEVNKGLGGWPKGLVEANVNDQFVLFTPTGTTYGTGVSKTACGEHFHKTEAYAFAHVAWEYEKKPGEYGSCELTVAAAHEYAESVTDPYGNGWGHGEEGGEIADKCQEEEWGAFEGGLHVPKLWDNHSEKISEECTVARANPPQVAPAMLTEAVSGVSASMATLHGTVKPEGLEIQDDWFEWGTKEPFEHQSSRESWFVGQESLEVNAKITGLASGTVYKYRLVTEDKGFEGGIQKGVVKEFKTAGLPVVTTELATHVNTFEPQLNASVNPNGADTHYHFEYDTKEYKVGEGAHGTSVPAPPKDIGSEAKAQSVSYTLKGLERNKTYYYRVVAENEAGITDGADESFMTLPPCKGAEEKCVWSGQPTPNPPPHTEDKVTGVSCVSLSSCVAVGRNAYTEGGFVEVWNGVEWKITNELSGFTGNFLGISCGSSTSCMIIGETENGGEPRSEKFQYEELFGWQIGSRSVPAPSGGTQLKLSAVSCSSSSFCMAVGSYYEEGRKDLVETWNGSAWSVQSPPAEGNAVNAMHSVSCPSSSSCFTVGELSSKATAEHWNGTVWSLVTPPNPIGAVGASLEGVSCSSTTSCMAVGNFHESGKESKTLTESWGGGAWSVKSSPNPEAKYGATLLGVSCVSASSCIAVGDYSNELFKLKTLGETWNGSTEEWSIQSSPNPTGATSSSLVSDSCTSSAACTAVGSANPGPAGEATVTLAERWNGTWSGQTIPNPPPHTEDKVTGVSCVSLSSCVAVGRNAYTEGGFVEVWNGVEWKITNELSGFTGNFLGISCGSSTSCMIIGETENGGEPRSEKFQYEELFGWQIGSRSVPAPSGGTQLKLSAVSCSSSSFCMAVGSYYEEGRKDLVETWNGSAWSVQSPPAEGDGVSAMRSVSCPSASSCFTVGELSSKATAEHWNGAGWSLITPASPVGAVGASLEGVACPSTASCVAVGNFHESGKESKTLTESWGGGAWSVKSSPNPEAKYGSTLLGVSCVSASSCSAVGDYSNELFKLKTLGETWNGSTEEWSIQSSPNPTGATSSSLVSDSCTSSVACAAVGSASPGPAGEATVTLAERYG